MSQEIVGAKEKELKNMIENDVFERVPFYGQATVSCKWVFTEKFENEKEVVKARSVARGFEKDSSDLCTDSPTCSKQSMRLVFLTAASNKWEIKSLDIKAAFLQGDKIERDVFPRPPGDVCPENEVWKLKRCIYGLNDAPRAWYSRVNTEMLKRGVTVSKYDSALFLWHKDGKLVGILAAYVDNFAYCGTYQWERIVVDSLKSAFQISSSARGAFRYVGLNVLQSKNGIKVDQNSYIAKIQPIYLESDRTKEIDSGLSKDEVSELKSISGQLLWATSQTRPDVAFEGCQVGNYGKHPTVRNILEANKAIRNFNHDSYLSHFLIWEKLRIYEFCAILMLLTQAYQMVLPKVHIFFLLGKNNMVAPFAWQSNKICRVTKSPLALETLSLSEVADAGFMIASMIQEINCLSSLPSVLCKTDNSSLMETLHATKLIKDIRLRVDIGQLREMVQQNEILIEWIDGRLQLADVLTKAGASAVRLVRVLESSHLF